MTTAAVIGLGFGDEGKGLVTDYLCSRDPGNTAVVRFSGGHQCGHKVVKDDVEHIFASFGSGTLSGCPTYWSRHCTFEPVGFWEEYKVLQEKGIVPRILIHPDCPATTVFDVFVNRHSVEVEHGTTGTGFFRTKKRHEDGVKLTVSDLILGEPEEIEDSLRRIRLYFGANDNLDLTPFLKACANIRQLVLRGEVRISEHVPPAIHLVFEGSQGLLLDERIGTMPHCTPSDVTPRNARRMVGELDEVYLVSRVYQTRHGNGPMTNIDHPVHLDNTEKETNKHNKYQGEFRKTVLDIDQLLHAKTEGIDKVLPVTTCVNLVLTCADQMSPYKISVGTGVLAFGDVDEFAKFIGNALEIHGGLYVNTSPRSSTVRKVGS